MKKCIVCGKELPGTLAGKKMLGLFKRSCAKDI